jgi:hypothetical protein
MSWIVEFESNLDPSEWRLIPNQFRFELEEDAWAALAKWKFDAPDRAFRVREGGLSGTLVA